MYNVFIVEDDPMVLSINQRFIEKLSDFKVIGVSRKGKEPTTEIINKKPDLLLLDFFMPEQNGLELLREIRSSKIHTEVIMITAAQEVETITEALRLGVLDYIIKPYGFDRLRQALEVFLLKMDTIKDNQTLTQREIDQMKFSTDISKNNLPNNINIEELPKGLDEITLNKIKKAIIKNNNPISSKDMADALNLSRITVRKYLEYLVDVNMLNVQLKYGSLGRPSKLYYASETQQDIKNYGN